MTNKILIIDIETTGLFNKGGKIVEVGMAELDVITGSKRIVFNSICHERPITREEVENSWIVKNSNLTVEQIQTSKQFIDIKGDIQKIINQYPKGCTAYNNKFDFTFLEDRGITFIKKLACPMMLSMNVLKIKNPYGYANYKWPSVMEAYKYFFPNSNYVELHRGADDAKHEADIVFALINLGIFKC